MMSSRFSIAVKRAQRAIIRAVQAVLVPVFLVLAYTIVLGLTWPLALLFAPRKGLGLFTRKTETYWRVAEGYEGDMTSCREPF